MSRLCRLKTASHGEDGKWAYDEIVRLREQLAAAQADNERLRDALLRSMGWNWLDDDIFERVDVRQFQEAATSPINRDALHEKLAEAYVEAAYVVSMTSQESSCQRAAEKLREMAAAYRAKKEGK